MDDPTVTLGNAISALRPGAQWSLRGPTLADLEWLDTEQTEPTQAEIDAMLVELAKGPVPDISRRQFYQQLAVQGIATVDEAIAAVATGALPASLQGIVNALPTAQQFPAKMLLIGGGDFERTHPMSNVIGMAYGWSSSQIDDFFRAASVL